MIVGRGGRVHVHSRVHLHRKVGFVGTRERKSRARGEESWTPVPFTQRSRATFFDEWQLPTSLFSIMWMAD